MNAKELAEKRLFPILVLIAFFGIVVSFSESFNKVSELLKVDFYFTLIIIFIAAIVFLYFTPIKNRKLKVLVYVLISLTFCGALVWNYYEINIRKTKHADPPQILMNIPLIAISSSIIGHSKYNNYNPTFSIEEFYLNDELCSFTESSSFKFGLGPDKYRTFEFNRDVKTAFDKGDCVGPYGKKPINNVLPLLQKRLDSLHKPELKAYIKTSDDLSRIIVTRGDIFNKIMFSESEIENFKKSSPNDFNYIRDWLVNCIGVYNPVIIFNLKNTVNKDIIISKIVYDVLEVGQVKGGETGPMYPIFTYNHVLKHQVGLQSFQLNPSLRLNKSDNVAFNIRIIPNEKEPGLCWLLKIRIFDSEGNEQSTEPFQIIMSK